MDWLTLLETYGVPLVVACAFWLFIQKRTAFIEKELMEDLEERFKRLEGIIIELISQQKKIQIEQRGLERSFKALVEIVAKMSGNGLRERLLRIQQKGDDDD